MNATTQTLTAQTVDCRCSNIAEKAFWYVLKVEAWREVSPLRAEAYRAEIETCADRIIALRSQQVTP